MNRGLRFLQGARDMPNAACRLDGWRLQASMSENGESRLPAGANLRPCPNRPMHRFRLLRFASGRA